MKKIIVTIITFILAVGLCSCGGPTPTETVDSFLSAVKAEDSEVINSVYSSGDFEFNNEIYDPDSDDEFTKELYESLIPKILEFEYEISNEKIEDDKATVDVKFTTYNIGSTLTSFMSEYVTQAMALAFSNASDEQIVSLGETLLKSKIDTMEKNYTDTVSVSLTQKDGTWIIDEFEEDGDFYNAFLGGAVDAVNDLEKAYDF